MAGDAQAAAMLDVLAPDWREATSMSDPQPQPLTRGGRRWPLGQMRALL